MFVHWMDHKEYEQPFEFAQDEGFPDLARLEGETADGQATTETRRGCRADWSEPDAFL
jgi:hypothetical protein